MGDIVIPKIGPHKGVKHEVIAVLDGDRYNIKPLGLKASQIKYRLGAAGANGSDLDKDVLNEDPIVRAGLDQGGRTAIRGTRNLVKRYPELNLQTIVDDFLIEKGVNQLEDLSIKDAYDLNIKIIRSIPSTQSNFRETDPSLTGGSRKIGGYGIRSYGKFGND